MMKRLVLRMCRLCVWLSVVAAGITMMGCLILPIPYKGYPHKTIQGMVVDAQNGKPLDDSEVRFVHTPIFREKERISGKTSHDGSFIIQPEKGWAFGYVLYIIMDPIFTPIGLTIEKKGYESAGIVLSGSEYRAFNYRLFKGRDDLGTIKLIKGPETIMTIYAYNPFEREGLLKVKNEENPDFYKMAKDFLLEIRDARR